MLKTFAIAALTAAGVLAGCAAVDPKSSAPTAAANVQAPRSRTGSLLQPLPAASQPVKAIGNAAWREEHEKPQPMPAGN